MVIPTDNSFREKLLKYLDFQESILLDLYGYVDGEYVIKHGISYKFPDPQSYNIELWQYNYHIGDFNYNDGDFRWECYLEYN